MSRWSFAIAVGVTSVVLVAAIGVGGLLAVRSTLAAAPFAGGPPWAAAAWFAGHGPGGSGFQVPPQLQGLASLPPDQRFAHFTGVQVNLKDQNNQPLTVNVTPGTATAASATSLTMTANDGSTKAFTLSSSTAIHGAQGQTNIANGDKLIVVTLNNDTTAMAVVDGGSSGFGAGGFGPWHR